jgi:hypothetical protein
MTSKFAILVALILVPPGDDCFAVNGASRCRTDEAPLGNDLALKLPTGFCEYHFDGPDFVTGRVVRSGSTESLAEFYAGYAGPDLERITHDNPAEVCAGPIVEKPTSIAYLYSGAQGFLVLRSRAQTAADGTSCRQATWHVQLRDGSKSAPLLVLEYFAAGPTTRTLADKLIETPIVRQKR